VAVLATTIPLPGAAQPPAAELRLLAQTPVVGPPSPLRLTVAATNTGAVPLEDLVVSLWIYNPARSRSAYHQGLTGEPPTEPLLVRPFRQAAPLASGETRELTLERRIRELESRGENALYPVKVQLESGGVAVAALRTVVVFIDERPLVPLNVSFVFVLDAPVRLRPDGALIDTALEEELAEGGRLETLVSALEEVPARATIAVSPLLLETLAGMADGYRLVDEEGARDVPPEGPGAAAAGAMLERVRALARSPAIEVLALPYASPSIPTLVRSGLAADLEQQLQAGREGLEATLGAPLQTGILYPPGSEITSDALDALPPEIHTLVLDAETLPPPQDLVLSPPPTARLGSSHQAAVPDPDLASYLEPAEDPRLSAQLAIGELSALYFEEPSVLRGAVVLIDEETAPAPAFLVPLLRAIAEPPPRTEWLRPTKVSSLVAAVPPDGRRRLAPQDPHVYSPDFVQDLRDGREAIDQYASMTGEGATLPAHLATLLLLAESRDHAGSEADARAFITAVRSSLAQEFDKIDPPSGSSVTLTSHGGVIPVTMRNATGYDVRVRVTLRSPRLEFLEGGTREVVLSSEAHALTFPVRAQTTGRFPVRILVDTPSGRRITESQIVVRSTAYNRVALLVTIGAALFLAAWWGRRFLRRPTP